MNFDLLCISLRAQKEAEAGNSGDAPLDDEPGGAEDELIEGDVHETNDDSPEDSLGKQSQQQQQQQQTLPPASSKGGGSGKETTEVASGSQTAKNAESASKRDAKCATNAEPPSDDSAPSSQRVSLSLASGGTGVGTSAAGASSTTAERQARRLKGKERAEKGAGNPAPLSSAAGSSLRGSRQGTAAGGGGGGRSRGHGGSRNSGGGGGNEAQTNQLSASVTATSTAAASNRLSPMGGVVNAAAVVSATTPTSSPRKGRKEDGWKEVGRR